MNPLIRELVGCAKDPAAVARFAEEHPVPLVARDHVTFVFVGDADAVNLRHWIFGLPGSYELTRVPHTKVWTCDFELPARSRVEYKIEVVREGHGEWILDPLNPRRAHDPFGANSVCYGPGYERPAWTEHDPEARTGSLDLIAVDIHGRVLANVGYEQGTGDAEFEMGGYALVADAIHGWIRDDAWVLRGQIYRVVGRPVERSQKVMLPELSPLTSVLPSGENATVETED